MAKFTFDMPHALVTLTDVDGNVEIEVWPKAGQSAYVVVPAPIARAIADQIGRMADAAAESAAADAADSEAVLERDEPDVAPATASNVVDFASRRRPN